MSSQDQSKVSSWDIFSQAGDGLRDLTLLTSQLATDPTRRVRLFIDDPSQLSNLSPRIDGTLWVQPLILGELWRTRLAEVVAPADNIVCVNECDMPARYRERIAYGAGAQRRVLRVWSLGRTPVEADPDTTADHAPSALSIDVLQDESSTGTGLIKAPRSTADMRVRWKAQSDLTQATLEGLGLRGHLARGTLILFCWGIRIPSPVQFCRVLERACEKPVLLITVDTNDSQMQAVSCAGDNLSCQNLRMPGWSQMDELVWGSDLIFCSRRDIAHRAMEAGTPMLWMREDDGLFDWYFDGQDPAFKRSLTIVAYHLRQVGTPSSELLWLLNQRESLESIARNAARRFALAPLLADSLPGIVPKLAEQARQRDQGYRNSHQPTTPMTLQGS